MEQPADVAASTEAGTATGSGRSRGSSKEHDESSGKKDREEWSEAAICTLIDAYTAKYGELNGKGLRSKDWAEVVDVVNRHQNSTKTVEHCRNKMDTLTKRYKAERKNKLSGLGSSWPWYGKMEIIRGCSPGKSHEIAANSALGKEKVIINNRAKKRGKKLDDLSALAAAETLAHNKQGSKLGAAELKADAAHVNFMPEVLPSLVNFHRIDAVQNLHSSAAPPLHDSSGLATAAAHNLQSSAAPPLHNSSGLATAAAATRAVVANEQATSKLEEGNNLARSIAELARSLTTVAGSLASSITGFAEIYARVEVAKMETLKDLELKRMQMQLDCQLKLATILNRGSGKRKRESSPDSQ